ncbi:MAG: hypothetical protein Q4A09_04925 [Capnocytophaga felis]|nr:hypothetical protein [Capnocytophaga felis]
MINTLKLLSVPIILLYSIGSGATYLDRLKYLGQSIWVSFPFIVVYNHLSSWHDANSLFVEAASIIIFINMIVGGASHWKQGTFSWKSLAIKNFFIIFVVLSTYLVLDKLFGFFADTFVGGMLKSSISFMVLMYPASKFMSSLFIFTNGKFPPMYLMKMFYSYEKSGRIKDFFDLLSGEGIKDLATEHHEEDNEADVHQSTKNE